MASYVAPTVTDFNLTAVGLASWVLANGDTGRYIEIPQYSDKTMHIYGTFGAAGSMTLRGSNDPRVLSDYATFISTGTYTETASWIALVDPQGNAITKTAASIETILENTRFISPLITAGDGTTALTIAICAKRTN